MSKTILLSYPRSGVSWLRYLCRELLGEPHTSAHYEDNGSRELCGEPYISAHYEDNNRRPSKFIKTHWLHSYFVDFDMRLIVIVRNYKECIVRHNKADYTLEQDFNFHETLYKWIKPPGISYIHPINIYDNCDKPKHILYYEDLLEYPDNEIARLAEFLGVDKSIRNKLLTNYTKHEYNSKRLYTNDENVPESTSLIYHSKLLSTDDKIRWDKTIEKMYPILYDRYLSRYKE